ncbi:Uncharacterised protein [Mycobacteroides abscessus]|nr:Uncharacterised protein [Mycobacteroides abscessus]
MANDACRGSSACTSGRSASVSVQAGARRRSSCSCASRAASRVVRGRSVRNASSRSWSKAVRAGSGHRTGPSLLPSARTPLARKLATGVRTSRSRFMWVTKRGPLTANVKPSGVWSRHATNDDGRCNE